MGGTHYTNSAQMHPNMTHVTGLVMPQFLSGIRTFIQRSSSLAFWTTLSISAFVMGSCAPCLRASGAGFFPPAPAAEKQRRVTSLASWARAVCEVVGAPSTRERLWRLPRPRLLAAPMLRATLRHPTPASLRAPSIICNAKPALLPQPPPNDGAPARHRCDDCTTITYALKRS